jgi:hypothetical protein
MFIIILIEFSYCVPPLRVSMDEGKQYKIRKHRKNRDRICKCLRSQESIPPGWKSFPGLLKRFTNTGSRGKINSEVIGWLSRPIFTYTKLLPEKLFTEAHIRAFSVFFSQRLNKKVTRVRHWAIADYFVTGASGLSDVDSGKNEGPIWRKTKLFIALTLT